MRLISLSFLVWLMTACNNAATIDHIDALDSTAKGVDSAVTHIDTPRTIAKVVKHKSANIAYSYFTTIKRNDLKHISAYLSITQPEATVKETLRKIERTQRINSEKEDSSIIHSLNIPLVYEYVEISLLDPAADYTITKVGHNNDKQMIDTVKGNQWDWTVITKTNKKDTRLILKITAFLPNASEELENRSIPIRIKLEQSILRKLWATLLDDPKYLLTAILIPLIAFFGKQYFDKKKVQKKENQA